jgi:hypothetical protein
MEEGGLSWIVKGGSGGSCCVRRLTLFFLRRNRAKARENEGRRKELCPSTLVLRGGMCVQGVA